MAFPDGWREWPGNSILHESQSTSRLVYVNYQLCIDKARKDTVMEEGVMPRTYDLVSLGRVASRIRPPRIRPPSELPKWNNRLSAPCVLYFPWLQLQFETSLTKSFALFR